MKTIILAVALLAVAMPSHAQSKTTKAMLGAWIACQSLDAITTAVALRNPQLQEGNPLLRGHVFAVKLSVNVGLGVMQHAITQREPQSAKRFILPLAMAGSGCLAGGLNTRTLRNLR